MKAPVRESINLVDTRVSLPCEICALEFAVTRAINGIGCSEHMVEGWFSWLLILKGPLSDKALPPGAAQSA